MSLEKVIKSIPVKFANYEKVNDTVGKVKIFIMYAGVNRNGSYMSKEAVEKAIPSLYGVPIVGEYLENAQNFGGHGGKIVIDSNGIEFIETTRPYGFLDMSEDLANVRWEEVEDEEGNKKNYLVADAYLWRKRYPELDVVFENGANQSMEINVFEAEWKDKENYYDISDFKFDALCILGKDEENEEFNVEPCFEDSAIESYSLNKEDFKAEFSLMMKEIKESFQVEEVIEIVEIVEESKESEIIELIVEEVVAEEFESVEIEIEVESVVEESEQEQQLEQVEEVVETVEVVEEVDYKIEYKLLLEKFNQTTTELELAKSTLTSYQEKEQLEIEAQLNIQKDEIFEKYDELLLENEEYIKIKESKSDYTIEMLETTLAVLYVKSNVQFSAKQSNKSSIIKLGNEDELNKKTKPVVDPYGGLFTKNN